ncbi:hypothetical protein AZA_78570 [Nitrospirillum viridazoti Y2]|nr:hypothetical protein AZA_78570 [Nitrospirillum amazonense Y2]
MGNGRTPICAISRRTAARADRISGKWGRRHGKLDPTKANPRAGQGNGGSVGFSEAQIIHRAIHRSVTGISNRYMCGAVTQLIQYAPVESWFDTPSWLRATHRILTAFDDLPDLVG